VTADYLVHAQELEIKMAQAKVEARRGRQLRRAKSPNILRDSARDAPGTPLISPLRITIFQHRDLAQLIHDWRTVHPRARIGVKLPALSGLRPLRHLDFQFLRVHADNPPSRQIARKPLA